MCSGLEDREHGIDVVAVTGGPGLALCLKVGFVTGTLLAATLKVPLVVVNHLEVRGKFATRPTWMGERESILEL